MTLGQSFSSWPGSGFFLFDGISCDCDRPTTPRPASCVFLRTEDSSCRSLGVVAREVLITFKRRKPWTPAFMACSKVFPARTLWNSPLRKVQATEASADPWWGIGQERGHLGGKRKPYQGPEPQSRGRVYASPGPPECNQRISRPSRPRSRAGLLTEYTSAFSQGSKYLPPHTERV